MRRFDVRNEHGVVTVMVALLLPLFLLLGVFVIDVANWWVHKRHLQVQADAAALAGGALVQPGDCNGADVEAEARKYTYDENSQVGNTPDDRIGFQLELPVLRRPDRRRRHERAPGRPLRHDDG